MVKRRNYASELKICQKIVLLPFLSTFGQCHDLPSSQLQAIFPLFSSYPPLGRVLPSYASEENGVLSCRNVYLVKIGAKTSRDGSQDIYKDKESNLGPVAGC